MLRDFKKLCCYQYMANGVNKCQAYLLHCHASETGRGSCCCNKQHALFTNERQSCCSFIILVHIFSIILPFFQFEGVSDSVTVQNQTYLYMNLFGHANLGNLFLQLCPYLMNHSVYIHTYIRTYTHRYIHA